MTLTERNQQPLGGNTSTGLLKLIALICMFVDHFAVRCVSHSSPIYMELRMIGRIAFPLYCWCMVVGACRTRSMPRYLLRLGLVGLISQPIYMVAMAHAWDVPNIFLTLLLGLCGVWGMQKKKWGSHIWAPALALMASIHLNCATASYGWRGVLLIMLLYLARGSRKTIAATMIPFCLFWGSGSVMHEFFGLSLKGLTQGPYRDIFSKLFQLQSLAILALPLMIWPDQVHLPIPAFLRAKDDERTHLTLPTRMPTLRMPVWLSYSLYPGHLAVLIGVQYAMGVTVQWRYLTEMWTALTTFAATLPQTLLSAFQAEWAMILTFFTGG